MQKYFSTEINSIKAEMQRTKEDTEKRFDMDSLAERIHRQRVLNIMLKYYLDDARWMFVREVLPMVCEEFSKYVGKSYGEKTKQKIIDALKSRCNCIAYIHREQYSQTLVLMPLDDDGYNAGKYGDCEITVYPSNLEGSRYGFFLDDNNKISNTFQADFSNGLPRWAILDNCQRFIAPSEIKSMAEEIVSRQDKLDQMWEEFGKAINEYNDMIPSKCQSRSQYNYKMF